MCFGHGHWLSRPRIFCSFSSFSCLSPFVVAFRRIRRSLQRLKHVTDSTKTREGHKQGCTTGEGVVRLLNKHFRALALPEKGGGCLCLMNIHRLLMCTLLFPSELSTTPTSLRAHTYCG
uniref:Uncharacterized protein ORF118 n=1 Tax=Nothoceros aenigmaticus TaxID=13813 RepID=C3RYQ3_9EMBR|nr:hypothetical protein MeaeMp52 [Nothoceros aenigmaticus]ACC86809.1 hypothetical protein MeaeMp52 [Nothoceros aenigmaticus]